MTTAKCREVLDRYAPMLANHPGTYMQHLRDMLPTMSAMLVEINTLEWNNEIMSSTDEQAFVANARTLIARREKFMRWLGFMQGVLWVKGIYTLEELMAHNREE